MGYFTGGRFNLTVSLRYTPAPNEVRFICEVFTRASKILSDATSGSHRIGTVLYAINKTGSASADVWIHPRDHPRPNSTGARLWRPNTALDMSQDYLMWPTILAHELSHYVYDLRDEYNNGSSCQGNIALHASLMEAYPWTNYTRWTDQNGCDYDTFDTFFFDYIRNHALPQEGEPSKFCHAANHNATANNDQNRINHRQSCWTYMANDANHNLIPYGLPVPGPGGPGPAPPAGPPAVECAPLIPVQRFMLVLDRSASMTGIKFDLLKLGADFWVDYVNPPEELGVVTCPPAADVARSEVSAARSRQTQWRDDRHRIIDGLVPGGAAAIGDALRTGLAAIVAGGRAASQVMVLLTNGRQDAGSETVEQVLADLRANGVRVYTVGLGIDQDAALLENVATTTGASYFPIYGDLSPAQAEAAITQALVQIAGQSRENGGVVAFNDIDGTGAPIAEGAPFFGSGQGETGDRSFRFPVTISSGSTHATLGVLWRDRREQIRVRIYNPSGAKVTAGPKVRAVRGQYPYAFYEVDQPIPGIWEVEVIGSRLGAAGLRSIGFEVNPRVRLDATATPHHAVLAGEIQLRARLLSPYPVPRARMIAHVYSPAGSWETVQLGEGSEGTAEEGLYSATVPTDREDPGQYLIVLEAFTNARTFTIKVDEIYTFHPYFKPDEEPQTVATPEVHRQAVLSVVTSQSGPMEEAIVGANDVDPVIPANQDEHLTKWLDEHPQQRRSVPTPS